jgi:hypothetical protein
MRKRPVTRERARSDCMISPSIQVENRLIIPRLDRIGINRTIALHDPTLHDTNRRSRWNYAWR